MAVIGWGKPNIVFGKIGEGNSWSKMQTPVQNSTTLSTEKGDKQEALVEGGGVEDVRYNKNKYSLTMTIRVRKGGTSPIPHNDGIVSGEYMVALQPEDTAVPGIVMQKAHVSVEDAFSTEEGTTFIYTFDGLVPDDNSNQVKHGVVVITESSGSVSAVKVTVMGSETQKTLTLTDGSLS